MRSLVRNIFLGSIADPDQFPLQEGDNDILHCCIPGFAGDYVAHIKFTVLLMPNGSDRVTSHPLQELQPTKTIDDPEIKAWLALGTKTKKKGGGKKKKGKLGLDCLSVD